MARWLATLISATIVGGSWTDVRQQTPVLLVRVLESASGRTLPNAEVIDLESSARRFTNADGEARLAWPTSGHLRLRVRQLGFQFIERDLTRAPERGAADTVTVSLDRVAYALPDVATKATGCSTEADATTKALSVLALSQLSMGAERYESFRKTYPFEVRQKRRTIRFNLNGTARQITENSEEVHSNDWGERYAPGKVVDRSSRGFSVPLLFLAALADPVFWRHHCFTVRGVETLGADRVLRLAFVPTPTVSEPDWLGTAFVDSATSMLRRVEFQIAGLGDRDIPRRLEGYTTFRSPSPFIVIPDSTVAMWWRRDPTESIDGWKGPDVAQVLHVLEVSYRKARPPGS
ncbi:MAG TPA: hypothetical protein VM076_00730 [Gemmatimonadaceae bacterium]|nr:hypothetical protein [Gemmatimonadaceae bacterium]